MYGTGRTGGYPDVSLFAKYKKYKNVNYQEISVFYCGVKSSYSGIKLREIDVNESSEILCWCNCCIGLVNLMKLV